MQRSISPGSPMIVPLRIHGPAGRGRVLALLDTGASRMTIHPEVADQLGYDGGTAPGVRIVTANGAIYAPEIVLFRVEIGEFVLVNVPALCVAISASGATSLLGLSLLRHLNVFVDNKAGMLTITDP